MKVGRGLCPSFLLVLFLSELCLHRLVFLSGHLEDGVVSLRGLHGEEDTDDDLQEDDEHSAEE